MKFKRDTIEYKKQKESFIDSLVEEACQDITKMDTLDNSGRSLFCSEAEVMYFKQVREFFKNSISKRIMNNNQDNSEVKVLKMTNNI